MRAPPIPQHGPRRWQSRAAGVTAAALALSVLWAANRVERSLPFAPLALAELVIRLSPGDVATFFIERLQHDAIRLLAAVATLALLVLGALAPERSTLGGRPRAWLAAVLFGVLTAAASLGGNVRASVAAAGAAGALAAVLYGVAVAWLAALADGTPERETDYSRRRAFALVGSAALGLALGGTLLGRLVGRSGPQDVTLRQPTRRASLPRRPPFPGIEGLSEEVTSAADHYVVDINLQKPLVDPDAWRLEVSGLVERPLELGLDELQERFKLIEEHSVLTCVSNEVGGPLVGSSAWTGVRLRDVLAEARVKSGAVDLLLSGADGYTVSLPLDVARDASALLAVGQNGEPLSVEHGSPCRLRVPRLYGMMNAKWLERIELVDHDAKGFWAKRGWSDVGVVRTQSRIDTVFPEPRAGRPSWIAGVAWAGDRRVARVEVSLDGGGSWRQARLRTPVSPLAWTQWAYSWTPERSGAQRIACRAIDGGGRVQDARRRRPHPSGATGYHSVGLEVS